MQPLMMRGRLTLSEPIKVIRLKSMHVSAQVHGTNVSKRSLCFKVSQRHLRNFGEPRNQTNFLACSCGKCVLFWRLPLQLASYVAHSGRHVSGRSIWLVSYIGVRYQDLLTITRVNMYRQNLFRKFHVLSEKKNIWNKKLWLKLLCYTLLFGVEVAIAHLPRPILLMLPNLA